MASSTLIDFRMPLRAIDEMFDEFGPIVNRQKNKAFDRSAKGYMSQVAKNKLGKSGPFRVKSGREAGPVKKKPGEKGIAISKKARIAGFRAAILVPEELEGKVMQIRTGNPLLLIREFGDVIDPTGRRRKGNPANAQYVFVHGELGDLFKGRRGAKKLRQKAEIKLQGKLNPKALSGKRVKPIIAKVRRVVQRPVLGIVKGWRAYGQQVVGFIFDGIREVKRQAERAAAKAAAKSRAVRLPV